MPLLRNSTLGWFLFVSVLLFSSALAAGKPSLPVLNAMDARLLKSHVGERVAVEGVVVSTQKGTHDGLRFLNFTENKSSGFTAALVPAVYPKFPNFETFTNKRVRVTGILERYKDKTVIKVSRRKQVKTLKSPKSQAPTDSPSPQKSSSKKLKQSS